MVIFDPNKARINLRKHGVRFSHCHVVFVDARSVTVEDWSHDERRFNTVGMSAAGVLVMVTWTERGDDIRIISARKAKASEASTYGK